MNGIHLLSLQTSSDGSEAMASGVPMHPGGLLPGHRRVAHAAARVDVHACRTAHSSVNATTFFFPLSCGQQEILGPESETDCVFSCILACRVTL
jgi:hypothetical protein